MADAILPCKVCARCNCSKSKSEFHSHQSTKDRLFPYCKECRKGEHRNFLSNSRARSAESRNKDKKAYYMANRTAAIQRALKWARDNPARAAARAMGRLALVRSASPAWADAVKICAIYEEAERLRNETGINWHVDHIVPIKSKFVCGLHVEHNLAVIPAAENIAKSNRYWPDKP